MEWDGFPRETVLFRPVGSASGRTRGCSTTSVASPPVTPPHQRHQDLAMPCPDVERGDLGGAAVWND